MALSWTERSLCPVLDVALYLYLYLTQGRRGPVSSHIYYFYNRPHNHSTAQPVTVKRAIATLKPPLLLSPKPGAEPSTVPAPRPPEGILVMLVVGAAVAVDLDSEAGRPVFAEESVVVAVAVASL